MTLGIAVRCPEGVVLAADTIALRYLPYAGVSQVPQVVIGTSKLHWLPESQVVLMFSGLFSSGAEFDRELGTVPTYDGLGHLRAMAEIESGHRAQVNYDILIAQIFRRGSQIQEESLATMSLRDPGTNHSFADKGPELLAIGVARGRPPLFTRIGAERGGLHAPVKWWAADRALYFIGSNTSLLPDDIRECLEKPVPNTVDECRAFALDLAASLFYRRYVAKYGIKSVEEMVEKQHVAPVFGFPFDVVTMTREKEVHAELVPRWD